MELKKYIYPLRRWWWLLLAATLVAAVSSFLVTLQQAPIYQARTTLMIGRATEDPNPTASEFWLGQQLAQTYADIASREMVRNATKASLGLSWLPTYQANALPNTQFLEIVVTDTNPERAQVVANELATQLILQSPTSSSPDEQSRREFINQQLDTLEVQIKQTQEDIQNLQVELGGMTSARQINDTQNQIAALQAKLTTLQDNYARLLANTQGGAVNTLNVIEPAGLPRTPIGPAKGVSILVASMIGLALAAGAAYLLEYLDDTVKGPSDLKNALGYPILTNISELDDELTLNKGKPFVAEHPRHPVAEAYRALRTNLEFAAVDRPLKTILVTSTDSDEGKTSVATNLAVVMAQGDKKVVLIDADLRRPDVHEYMGMTNEGGLSEVFRGRLVLHSAMRLWKNEKIAVISGGNPPPNPTELLASQKMDQILNSIKEVADVIIIDGPPFVVTDAAVLASKVDGVLVVIRPGYTRETAIKAMGEQLKRAGARVLGIVANRIPNNLQDYYGGQLYVSPYYSGRYFEQTKKPLTGWEKFKQALGFSSKPKPAQKSAPAALHTPSGSAVETPSGSKKRAE